MLKCLQCWHTKKRSQMIQKRKVKAMKRVASRVDEGYRMNCDQCENGVINLAYLASCPKCSWKDFYNDVNHQLYKLCSSTSPLNATHYIVFCSVCPLAIVGDGENKIELKS